MKYGRQIIASGVGFLAALMLSGSAHAYIEAAYSLGRVVAEATNIIEVKVEKVDNEKNLVIYRKVSDIKGKQAPEVIKHNIARGGFHPREWQFIMAAAQVGKTAIIFHNGSACETYVENYWYQTYPGGEWWTMNHGEPYLMRTYAGKPEKLVGIVKAMLAGQEVVVPCMTDGDKNALQLRTARMQRMKASMKIQDYDQKRDFAGWGNDEFKRINNMPGFSLLGALGRFDPEAGGIAMADINGDGQPDLCLWGEQKVSVLQNAGTSFDEIALPYTGGARCAAWGDYNGDGKPDLLLATPTGLKLFTNRDGKFVDDSAGLPQEPYYNLRAVAWIDTNNTGRPDILVANGFMGMRLYRNRGAQSAATQPAAKPAPLFEDVSDQVGLGLNGIGGNIKGDYLAVADVNGDGRADFFYSAGNGVLVINTPQGFVEARDSGISFPATKSAVVFADLNGDKHMDLLAPLPGAIKVFRNDGKGHFTDISAQTGELGKLTAHATSIAVCDFNKSGKVDVLVGCLRGSNCYFRNKGDGTFVDASDEIGLSRKIFNSRAIFATDLNKDGVPDLIMNNEGQDASVLMGAVSRLAVPATRPAK